MVPGPRGRLGNMTRHGYKHFVQKFFSPRCSKQFLIAMPCRTSHVPYKIAKQKFMQILAELHFATCFLKNNHISPSPYSTKVKNF